MPPFCSYTSPLQIRNLYVGTATVEISPIMARKGRSRQRRGAREGCQSARVRYCVVFVEERRHVDQTDCRIRRDEFDQG